VEKALIILNNNSSIYSSWIKNKVSNKYDPIIYYLEENLKYTKKEIINHINNLIKYEKIEATFFQGDYISLIDYDFITKINSHKKFIYLTDDFDNHEVNSLNALACNAIMNCCPLSSLKYEEKQLKSFFFVHESDESIFKKINLKKEIDVLFFGAMKANREELINKLKENNINFKIVGPANGNFLTYEELNKEINKSKIVINFTQTGNKNKFYSHESYPFSYLQVKGRVFISGFCGTLCISEDAPGYKLIFSEDTLPTFCNPNEMIEKINFFLKNSSALKDYTEKFTQECNKFRDGIYTKKVFEQLLQVNHKKVLKSLPIWYLRAFNLKNMRLYSKEKSIKKFLVNSLYNILIYSKYSNYKFLFIIIETLIYTPFFSLKIILNKIKI